MIEGDECYMDNSGHSWFYGGSRERASSMGSGSPGVNVEKWPSIKSLPSLPSLEGWNPDAQAQRDADREESLRWSPDVPWSDPKGVRSMLDSWNPDAPMPKAQKLGLERIPEHDKKLEI